MIFKNKQGLSPNIFGFFMILMILSGVLFFLTVGMHFILHDYGIQVASDIAHDTIGSINPANQQLAAIDNLQTSYLGNVKYLDMLFAVIIISMFIESIIASMKAKEKGFFTFFGYVTLGNVFLIFLMSYAIQLRGWFLNEIVYRILLLDVSTPFMTTFFNYSYYIGVCWFLVLVAVNQLNLESVKDRAATLFSRDRASRSEADNPEIDFGGIQQK